MSEKENNSILVRAASGSVRCVVPNMLRRSILALAALAALVFVSAGPSRAQSQSAASKAAPAGATAVTEVATANLAPAAQAATAKPAAASTASPGQFAPKRQQEGIKVHGHWTIEVKNPDGTVATHREFENSLDSPNGPNTLVGLLSGNWTIGNWYIELAGSPAGPCSTDPNGAGTCFTDPPNSPQAADNACATSATKATSGTQASCYATLSESLTGAPGIGGAFTSLTLGSTVFADQVGAISFVGTGVSVCPSITNVSGVGTPVTPTTISPSVCQATHMNSGQFTSTGLATPVNVAPGQIVSATVVISFQ